MGINTDAVQKLYVAYFNRPADVTGLAYWEGQLDAKKITIEGVAQSFSQQAEYTATYSGKSTAQVVDSIYQNLFGHSADIAGLKYWVGQLDNKVVNLGSAALAIANGATGNDALDVTNKVLAANAFTTAMDSTAKVLSYTGDAAYTAARTFLAGVTEVAATATAAVAAAPTVVAGLSSATNNGASTDTVLTTAQDIKTGTAGNDFFRAVAGAAVGSQDQTTLNSSDIIDGGLGQDQLIVNLTGNYQGGATIKNIETIKLGSDVVGTVNFDYNVNAGVNEITGVNTIVYDQINAGETLNVNNLVAKADGTSAGTTVTTVVTTTTGGTSTSTTSTANSTAATNGSLVDVSWVNDNVNRAAGTIGVNYRGNTIAGTADTQKISLTNITGGTLNVDAGVETFAVTAAASNGGTADTLANSTGYTVDLISGGTTAAAGNGSASTLKTVTITSAAGVSFGTAVGTTAATFNNRSTGLAAGTDAVGTDAAGLVSVASSVTTVDASQAAGNVNLRFTANATPSDIAVKYIGGSGNDYVEFERGDVNATGGAGNDTFAFITNAAGVTNATFGSTDTIVGGTGTDTIQIGLNGAGTYTLNTTEFNNKTGIDVLDVRGATTDITVSSEFVAAADAGKFVINTNKAGAGEAAATNVINTTALNQNQGIIVNGGAGSDRVVVNNASLNAAIVLDGGTNGGVAGRYDTLTILNTTVADAGDLANVKGFEAMILAETVSGNSRFDITLTDAFVLANTAATNDVATSIDDTVFRIGSAGNSSTGTALNAGDIVSIDISGLLNGTRTGLATTLTGRGIDAAGFAAGVTVNYVVDGAAATAAQIALVTKADANRADAGVNAAAGAVVVAPTFTGTAGADAFTLTANANVVTMLDGNDTVTVGAAATAPSGTLDGGNGADTLAVTAAANLSAATITGFETLNFGANAITISPTQLSNFTTAVNGTAGVTFSAAGSANDTVGSTATTYNFAAAGNSFTGNASVAYAITGAAGNDTFTMTAGFDRTTDVFDGGAGTADKFVLAYDTAAAVDLNTTANTLQNVEQFQSTVNQTGGAITLDVALNTVDLSAQTTALALTATGVTLTSLTLGASNDTINVLTTGATASTVNMGAGTDTITSLVTGAGAATITFGAGNDTITDIGAHGAGALTLKFGTVATGTQSLNINATTANLAIGDILDFATNVTSIITGAANGTLGVAGAVGQVFVDQAGGNTTITFDADGSRTFSAGDVQIVIVGNLVNGTINGSGDFLIGASA